MFIVLPSPSPTTNTIETTATERRGPVLDVLRGLLSDGRDDEVLALFRKLVTRNSELERRLAQMLARGRKNEGVSSAQLLLLLGALTFDSKVEGALDEANEKLRAASGIDTPKQDAPQTAPKRKQPLLRRPIPARLRRVDNPINVPDAERACPICGAERTCIGHDVTEVIELIPAELIVRRDIREKLACEPCESELVRAPSARRRPTPGGSSTRRATCGNGSTTGTRRIWVSRR